MSLAGGGQLPSRVLPALHLLGLTGGRAGTPPSRHPTTPRMWKEQFAGTARRLKRQAREDRGGQSVPGGGGPSGGPASSWALGASLALALLGGHSAVTICPPQDLLLSRLPTRTRGPGPWAPPSPGSEPPSPGALWPPKPTSACVHPAPLCLGQGGHQVYMASAPNARAPEPDSKLARVAVCPLGAIGARPPSRRHWPPRDGGVRACWLHREAQPAGKVAGAAGAGFMSPVCLGCTLLQSLEAQLGGRRRPLELSSQGPQGLWPQKQLGLRWASCPDARQGDPPPRRWARGQAWVTSAPRHSPQSQGSLWALSPPSLHLHTCCDGCSLPQGSLSRCTAPGLPGG
ncbi:uncharacterized protein LOC133238841 [Bos javanicus]|uniref:uncharacterized protein LOC133238841 n=1 Tax=Bos javanicus TaxID=9906 RepID=UPI002AA65978|nr:uncharacterized protein LOC133238841 [Bos javanicus]